MKKIIFLGLLAQALSACAVDYPVLLEAVKKYQDSYADEAAIKVIYEVARSEDYEEVVTRCMGIYTLHMGMKNNASTCQGGFQAICNRYPRSSVAGYLRELRLFPSPCETCLGVGIVQKTTVSGCSVCDNTGKCRRCSGSGIVKGVGLKGRTRIGLWKDEYGHYYHDYGRTETSPVDQPDIKCPVCKGSGGCTTCNGRPMSEHSSNVRCPSCNGISKGVDAAVARNGLMWICQELRDMLVLASDCETAYAQALQLDDPAKRLDALGRCTAKYERAINIGMVADARADAEKAVEQLTKQKQEGEESKRTSEQASGEQKRRILEQHESLLRAVRNTQSDAAARLELQKFLAENPDSPIIVEARLLAAEIEQRITAKEAAARRNRLFGFGCLGVMGLALLAWIVSCVRSAREKKVMIPVTTQVREPEPRKIPFTPSSRSEPAVAAKPRIRILQPATAATPEANALPCPECGAVVDCPADVSEEVVICASCRKAFQVH